MLRFFGTSNINFSLKEYFDSCDDLHGKVVIDIPAGQGYMSGILKQHGADVRSYDLFTEFFKAEGLQCAYADLMEPLPIESDSADIILCQEGLEHMPNQLFVLREFNRILKKDGRLIITVPNISHLRAKLSYFLTESDLVKRMPPNELDALWFAEDGKSYFGHIFLIGIQKLRMLAITSGFSIRKIHKVKASTSSLLLGIFYPLILLANLYVYLVNMNKQDEVPKERKKKVYREILKFNLHPTVLFGRHLFLELNKESELSDIDLYVNKR